MKRIAFSAAFILAVFLVRPGQGADEPLVLPAWPGKAVGDSGKIGPERVRAPRGGGENSRLRRSSQYLLKLVFGIGGPENTILHQ
ncbi:MAG TPA: hypothetical protein VJ809_15780 [Pirellulales bacterium]|jgi:hypothetical protein|nr:hypothetical protein [Pirellulales bacterium]